MERTRSNRVRNGIESQLTALMRSVVDARFRLERARDQLHKTEQKLYLSGSESYERQRDKALGNYIEAVDQARKARVRLLKELRDHTA